MLRKIFIKVLFCLPLLLIYMAMSMSGDVFTLDPVNIIARLANSWSNGVIAGIESEPIAFEYSKIFIYSVVIIIYIKFIRTGIRDRRIVSRVKGNFDIVLYVHDWIMLVFYSIVVLYLSQIVGFNKLITLMLSLGILLKIYTDFNDKAKVGK